MDRETREYLDLMHETNQKGFARMEERFDQMNGRVRTTESKVAVLEDRDDRAEKSAKSAKRSGLVSVLSAIATALAAGFAAMHK